MRRSGLVAALLLAGCSSPKLTSTLGEAPAPDSYVGAQPGALAAAAVGPELDALAGALGALARRDAAVPLRLTRDAQALRLNFGAGESFPGGSAELRPAALAAYAELARVVGSRPGTVVHIVVRGDAGLPSSDPSIDLPARRAASLQAYLAARGVPGTRLRAEGRASAEPDDVEVLLKPIVVGREAEAWMPPS